MKNSLSLTFLIFLFLFSSSVFAQTDSTDVFDMSLEDLLNMEVSVASKTALTTRESPGIVTVITEEEIRNSGARDLIDVLRLVPGINFGADVQGTVGIIMRGNWANEGKVLFLMDGQELNEILYATLTMGNRFDVTQIKRIEIIRGPGSSIYGGNAELGVVNIITKNGEDLQGVQAGVTYGQLSNTYGRINSSLAAGKKFSDDLMVNVSGFYGIGQRSGEDFVDQFGTAQSMKGNSDLNSASLNVGAKYKGLSGRFIYNQYNTTTVHWYDAALPKAQSHNFGNIYGELKYDFKISNKFSLTPKLNLVSQKPWNVVPSDSNITAFNVTGNKYTGGLHANYDPIEKLNLTFGAEGFYEEANNLNSEASPFFYNGTDQLAFQNFASYLQALVKHKIANLTVGGRFNYHSQYGSAFVPRVGLTKMIGKAHFKALYSLAYRAPALSLIATNQEINPEFTQVFEIEAGYQLTKKSIMTVNLYDMQIKDAIVYFVDTLGTEQYVNFDRSGTRGFEVDYRYRDSWGFINVNYTFATAAGNNKVTVYEVPETANQMIGAAMHSGNLLASFNITKSLSFAPSVSYLGKRYGAVNADVDGNPVVSEIDPTLLLNVFLNYKNLGIEGLDLGVGVYDLLNQNFQFINGYISNLSPLPSAGREFTTRISYTFKK